MIMNHRIYYSVIMTLIVFNVLDISCDKSTEAINHDIQSTADATRRIQSRYLTANVPYYVAWNNSQLLPRNNFDITIGNPLKGLVPSGTTPPRFWPKNLPASLTSFKWSLDKFMLADPDVVGESNAFNWTFIESNLNLIASFNVHAIIRFWIDYPGQPLRVPPYLLDPPYNLKFVNNETGIYFDDPIIKRAINQSIQALGRRYDGDPRIYMIQAGFFGAWGEWHASGVMTNLTNGTNVSLFPTATAEEAIPWYRAAFKKTHVQFRYPNFPTVTALGFGFHDDSYTHSTLGGIYAGNSTQTFWFFWNVTQRFNSTMFWKIAPMGGEVRPENVDTVFTPTYDAYKRNKQPFSACSDITHTSYMLWGRGWALNSHMRGVNGTELLNARNATVKMGYNFEIDLIAVAQAETGPSFVDIAVLIKQTGVSPFYYNLNVSLYCNGGVRYATAPVSIWSLLERGDVSTSILKNVPSTSSCLSAAEFRLESTYLYPTQRIRWAQGTNNGTIVMSIPTIPTIAPTQHPIRQPTSHPTVNSTLNPTANPTVNPAVNPTSASPTQSPTSTSASSTTTNNTASATNTLYTQEMSSSTGTVQSSLTGALRSSSTGTVNSRVAFRNGIKKRIRKRVGSFF